MDVSIAELLGSGLKLMVIGMGIVYFFLLLLVGVIQQTHRILQRIENQSSALQSGAVPLTADRRPADDRELVAAIAAAIHQYEQP